MNETISDKAIDTLFRVTLLKQEMAGINDYGEATGFCHDHDRIIQDFDQMLGAIRSRACLLQDRIQKTARQQKGPTQ